jgi:hypothetical protein
MQVVGITNHGTEGSPLGQEYLLTDSDHLISAAAGNSGHSSGPTSSSSLAGPASTLVGSSTGLEINLIWDSSVRSSSNWSAIEAAVVAAAKIYTQAFSDHVVLNIAVGFGEIAGSALSSNALGESESYGYITNYSTVANAMKTADGGLVSDSLMSSNALSVDGPPTGANFFVTSAEAKALGLISGTSTGIDGYIGLTSSSSLLYFSANGGTIGKTQYDAVGVVAHEISEVMGRIGLQGETLGSYKDVYTPLDLFRYEAPNVRDLTPTSGYFSTTDGVGGATNLNSYNNPQNGGDADDWASAGAADAVVNDSYDAFGTPGVITHVSATDLLEDAALGYGLTSTGLAEITGKTSIVA